MGRDITATELDGHVGHGGWGSSVGRGIDKLGSSVLRDAGIRWGDVWGVGLGI